MSKMLHTPKTQKISKAKMILNHVKIGDYTFDPGVLTKKAIEARLTEFNYNFSSVLRQICRNNFIRYSIEQQPSIDPENPHTSYDIYNKYYIINCEKYEDSFSHVLSIVSEAVNKYILYIGNHDNVFAKLTEKIHFSDIESKLLKFISTSTTNYFKSDIFYDYIKNTEIEVDEVSYDYEKGVYEITPIKFSYESVINGEVNFAHPVYLFDSNIDCQKFVTKEYIYFKKYKGISARKVIEIDPSYASYWANVDDKSFKMCYAKAFMRHYVDDHLAALEESLGEYYGNVGDKHHDVLTVSNNSVAVRTDKNHFILKLSSESGKNIHVFLSEKVLSDEFNDAFSNSTFTYVEQQTYTSTEIANIFTANIGKKIALSFIIDKNQIYENQKVSRVSLIKQ